MKNKLVTLCFVVLLVSTNAFADGDMPNGRSCQPNVSCLTQSEPVNNDKIDNESIYSIFVKIRSEIYDLFF